MPDDKLRPGIAQIRTQMSPRKPNKARRKPREQKEPYDPAKPVNPGQKGMHDSKSLVKDTMSKLKPPFPLLEESKTWDRQKAREFVKTFQRTDDCPYDEGVPEDPGNKLNCAGGMTMNVELRQCSNYEKCLIYNSLTGKEVTENGGMESGKDNISTERKSDGYSKENLAKTMNNANKRSYVCGAKLRGKDGVCRQPVSGPGERCRAHGGGGHIRNYTHGLYSRYASGNIKDYLERIGADSIQSMDEELALLKALITSNLKFIESDEADEDELERQKKIIDAIKTMAFTQDKKYQILERTRGMVTIEIANMWIKTIMKIAFTYIQKSRREEFVGEVKDRLNIG